MKKGLMLIVVCALFAAPSHLAAQLGPAFKVVINESNREASMTRAKLSTLFLKKVTRWGSGGTVQPIDLDDKSSLRQNFSQAVHGKEVAWIKSYWNKMIFSGRSSPPPEVTSEQQVLAFVRANPDAIGYVSRGTGVGSGLKVIEITD